MDSSPGQGARTGPLHLRSTDSVTIHDARAAAEFPNAVLARLFAAEACLLPDI